MLTILFNQPGQAPELLAGGVYNVYRRDRKRQEAFKRTVPKQTINLRGDMAATRCGRLSVSLSIVSAPSNVRCGGGSFSLKQNIRARSSSMSLGGSSIALTPARRRRVQLSGQRVKAVAGRAEVRDLQPNFEEEMAVLLAIL